MADNIKKALINKVANEEIKPLIEFYGGPSIYEVKDDYVFGVWDLADEKVYFKASVEYTPQGRGFIRARRRRIYLEEIYQC